ncbi:death-associated protein kinase 2-like [Oscarella lobularis]|uniref:death-associated protein kinase 2-like n=1 Tax=Oscarella lobularis TaxID=121494 RepID=UPI003313A8CC
MLRDEAIENAYTLETELGRGHFAVVMKCKKKLTGENFAVKIIPKKRRLSSRRGTNRDDILREVEAMELARHHPNLLQLQDALETSKQACLVTELVSGGELFEYLAEKDAFEESEAVDFMTQFLSGVSHLHARNVVHLDLKPENILLTQKSSISCIKLIDFGLARKLDDGDFVGMLGTPEFVAPEIVNYEPLSIAADMWAVGVIAYILLSGLSPFLGENDQETFQNVSAVEFEFFDEYFANQKISLDAINFIDHLLVKNPKKRMSAEECLSHPWIKPFSPKRGSVRTHALRKFNARRRWITALHAVRMSVKLKNMAFSYRRCQALRLGDDLMSSASDLSSDSDALSDSALDDTLERGRRYSVPSIDAFDQMKLDASSDRDDEDEKNSGEEEKQELPTCNDSENGNLESNDNSSHPRLEKVRSSSPKAKAEGGEEIKVFVTTPSQSQISYAGFRDGRDKLVKQKKVGKNIALWETRARSL